MVLVYENHLSKGGNWLSTDEYYFSILITDLPGMYTIPHLTLDHRIHSLDFVPLSIPVKIIARLHFLAVFASGLEVLGNVPPCGNYAISSGDLTSIFMIRFRIISLVRKYKTNINRILVLQFIVRSDEILVVVISTSPDTGNKDRLAIGISNKRYLQIPFDCT